MFCAVYPVCSCIPFPPACDPNTQGTQASLECSPLLRRTAGVEALELCTASVGLPWEEKQDSHPRAVSGPGPQRGPLWSLVSSRYDQEAAAGLLRSPPSPDMLRPDSLFPISRLPLWGGPLPLQLLKAQPCHVHLESCPQGPPGRSSAWVCL